MAWPSQQQLYVLPTKIRGVVESCTAVKVHMAGFQLHLSSRSRELLRGQQFTRMKGCENFTGISSANANAASQLLATTLSLS